VNGPPLHLLYAGSSELEAQRVDERTLELRAQRGWGALGFERMFTPLELMPRLGDKRVYGELEAEVVALTGSGLPAAVRFRFPSALEDSGRHWLIWEGTRAVPWLPPALGQRASFEPLSFLRSLPR
jgi:hypothetical protein